MPFKEAIQRVRQALAEVNSPLFILGTLLAVLIAWLVWSLLFGEPEFPGSPIL